MRLACSATNDQMTAEFVARNAMSLEQLRAEGDVEILPFPEDVLRVLNGHTQDIVNEFSASDPAWTKIADSYYDFMNKSTENQRVTEVANIATRSL